MEHIHWYPGHIAKAEKKLKEQVNIVDVVIEVLDARIPMSSTYPDIEKLLKKHPNVKDEGKANAIITAYVNKVCAEILFNTAVFKKDKSGVSAFNKFLAKVEIK